MIPNKAASITCPNVESSISGASKQIRKNSKQIKIYKRDSTISCVDSTSPSVSLQYEVPSRRASATVNYEVESSSESHEESSS